MNPAPLLTIEQVAQVYQVDPRTVRKWLAERRLAHVVIGHQITRVSPLEVARDLAAHTRIARTDDNDSGFLNPDQFEALWSRLERLLDVRLRAAKPEAVA